MAPGVDQAEMICYRWDISGSMGMDCPCLGQLGRSSVAILVTALDGEGQREGFSKAREGASTARDGAMATRRRGTAQRYGDGRRDGTTATRW